MFQCGAATHGHPRLLDFADDNSLDDQTHAWVYQALRDITGESLPRDAHAWRQWYARSRSQAEATDSHGETGKRR
jgi:hypothetical protein